MKKMFCLSLCIIVCFTACERVVDIDLNEASPAMVVEGRVIKDSLALVELHKTGSYFRPDTQQCVCNAIVVIEEDGSGPDTLEQIAPGKYRSAAMRGREGSDYHLKVFYDDQVFESYSHLSSEPRIYSLTPRAFSSFGDFGDSSDFNPGGGGETFLDSLPFFLFTNIYEDPDTTNYYLFRYCVNGEMQTGRYNVTADDNAENDTLKYSPGPTALFFPGDTVSVRAYAIDEGLYGYFDMLNDALSSNSFFASTPYNPVSNISGGALGYFAAMSFDCDTIIISLPPDIPGND